MSISTDPLPQDFEVELLRLLVKELLRRLSDPTLAAEMSASDFREIRALCESNSVSFSSIKRGDFGEVARRAAEEFPFDEEGKVVPLGGRQ